MSGVDSLVCVPLTRASFITQQCFKSKIVLQFKKKKAKLKVGYVLFYTHTPYSYAHNNKQGASYSVCKVLPRLVWSNQVHVSETYFLYLQPKGIWLLVFWGFFFWWGGGGQTRSKFIFNRRISNWFPCYKQKPLIKIKLTPCQCHISRSLLLLPASVTSVPGVKGHRRTSLQSSFPQVATQHDHQN